MPAAMGDNQKVERERRVLFSYYHKLHRDLEAERKAIGERIKTVKLNAKGHGYPSQKLDHYLKAFSAEDQQKPVDKLKSDKENLTWMGLIPDSPQGDLLADRASREQLIAAKGFHAGLTGLDRVSHYDGGSADDKLFLESYDAGRKEYDTVLPDVLARAEAEASKESPPSDGDPFAGASDSADWNKAKPTGKPN